LLTTTPTRSTVMWALLHALARVACTIYLSCAPPLPCLTTRPYWKWAQCARTQQPVPLLPDHDVAHVPLISGHSMLCTHACTPPLLHLPSADSCASVRMPVAVSLSSSAWVDGRQMALSPVFGGGLTSDLIGCLLNSQSLLPVMI
jgi:hypothetical protein